jgi:N utilization substance protein B
MLYECEIGREPIERVSEAFWRLRSTTDETRARAEQLARGTVAHLDRIDQMIAAAATHWPMARIAAVDRNIMRVGVFELLAELHTPAAVVLDEAVEMAKRFGEADSPAFVNGVLDAIRRQLRPGEGKRERDC